MKRGLALIKAFFGSQRDVVTLDWVVLITALIGIGAFGLFMVQTGSLDLPNAGGER